MEIDYFSPTSDKESKRVITPFHFFEDNGIEYRQAHCHLAQSSRTFRVDRISGCTVVAAKEPVEATTSDTSAKVRALVAIHSLDRATIETLDLESEDVSPGATVPVEAYSPEWLVRAIMETDSGLEIIEPASLREMIAKRVDAAIALYE